MHYAQLCRVALCTHLFTPWMIDYTGKTRTASSIEFVEYFDKQRGQYCMQYTFLPMLFIVKGVHVSYSAMTRADDTVLLAYTRPNFPRQHTWRTDRTRSCRTYGPSTLQSVFFFHALACTLH